jgi:hypothetical protein
LHASLSKSFNNFYQNEIIIYIVSTDNIHPSQAIIHTVINKKCHANINPTRATKSPPKNGPNNAVVPPHPPPTTIQTTPPKK